MIKCLLLPFDTYPFFVFNAYRGLDEMKNDLTISHYRILLFLI